MATKYAWFSLFLDVWGIISSTIPDFFYFFLFWQKACRRFCIADFFYVLLQNINFYVKRAEVYIPKIRTYKKRLIQEKLFPHSVFHDVFPILTCIQCFLLLSSVRMLTRHPEFWQKVCRRFWSADLFYILLQNIKF